MKKLSSTNLAYPNFSKGGPASSKRSEDGFTIIELLIVMTLMAIMGAVGIGYYFNYQRQTMLKSSVENIQSFLYVTQQRSIGQEDSSQWGVHFEHPTGSGKSFYASFKGTSYSTAVETHYLDGALDFTYPAEGTSFDIVFDRITGKISDGTTKKVYVSLTTGEAMRAVNVSPFGVMTMNDGEIGWWKLDEGNGTTAGDSSGYDNKGTIQGGTWTTGCKSEGCLILNGQSDYITLTNTGLDLTFDGSVTAWFKSVGPNQLSTLQMIVDRYSAGYGYAIFLGASGKLSFRFGDKTVDNIGTGFNDNQWHFVAMVNRQNPSGFEYYVDGVRTASGAGTTVSASKSASTYLGSRAGGSYFFNGPIDDVRIYDHALSETEVKHIYETTK